MQGMKIDAKPFKKLKVSVTVRTFNLKDSRSLLFIVYTKYVGTFGVFCICKQNGGQEKASFSRSKNTFTHQGTISNYVNVGKVRLW